MACSQVERDLVEVPLCQQLVQGGHEIRRQLVCGAGRIDIYDETTSEIIECKRRGDMVSLTAAVRQLKRYYHHFFDPQMAIAVPRVESDAQWLADLLEKDGIRIIQMELGGTGV